MTQAKRETDAMTSPIFSIQQCPQCLEVCRHRRHDRLLYPNRETKVWELFVGFECGNCLGMMLMTPEQADDPATWEKIAELTQAASSNGTQQ